jgi:hypothetical protein
VATFVALTMHGWWWPGRQLVVVLPLGVVAVAVAVERLRAARLALGVGTAAGAVTWVWSTVDAIARRRVLVVDFDRTANPAVRVWQRLLPDGQSAGTADDWRLAAASAVVAALAVAGWRAAGRRPTPPL